MVTQPELVIESQALLGECPCWHQEKQLLYWVDILKQQFHIYHPETKKNRTIDIGEFVGGVAPRSNGEVILGLKSGFGSLDLETEEINILARPKDYTLSHRFNDGKCDPVGRNKLYITTARKDMDETALNQYPHAGNVFRVNTDAIGMKSFEFVAG